MSTQQESINPSGNSLTADQIALVKQSWRLLSKESEAVAACFYTRLFELDEDMKLIFSKTNIQEQGKKFADTITVVVKGLDQLELLIPAIGELGNRHLGYGVNDKHYTIVKKALLDSLEASSPENFTEEIRDAWTCTYNTIATIMKDGPSGQTLTSPGI